MIKKILGTLAQEKKRPDISMLTPAIWQTDPLPAVYLHHSAGWVYENASDRRNKENGEKNKPGASVMLQPRYASELEC